MFDTSKKTNELESDLPAYRYYQQPGLYPNYYGYQQNDLDEDEIDSETVGLWIGISLAIALLLAFLIYAIYYMFCK